MNLSTYVAKDSRPLPTSGTNETAEEMTEPCQEVFSIFIFPDVIAFAVEYYSEKNRVNPSWYSLTVTTSAGDSLRFLS